MIILLCFSLCLSLSHTCFLLKNIPFSLDPLPSEVDNSQMQQDPAVDCRWWDGTHWSSWPLPQLHWPVSLARKVSKLAGIPQVLTICTCVYILPNLPFKSSLVILTLNKCQNSKILRFKIVAHTLQRSGVSACNNIFKVLNLNCLWTSSGVPCSANALIGTLRDYINHQFVIWFPTYCQWKLLKMSYTW